MEIIEFDLDHVPTNYSGVSLCLGFFDGIHLGHKDIISNAIVCADRGAKVAVLSFSTPPAYVIGRKDTNRSLTSIDDKADLLEKLGVDYLFIMPFDNRMKNLSRLDFVNLVLKKINPSFISCGEDYRFGKDALGTPKFLSHYFKVYASPLLKFSGEKFSSKNIRHLIFDGNIKKANMMLGHLYRIGGIIVQGKQNGQKLGFRTANLELDFPYVIPANGVYMGYAYVYDEKYKCLISIGTHPTLAELDASLIEVYIIDFDEMIYGDFIFIEFVDRLRDIQKFASTEELIKQIKKDKEIALKSLI